MLTIDVMVLVFAITVVINVAVLDQSPIIVAGGPMILAGATYSVVTSASGEGPPLYSLPAFYLPLVAGHALAWGGAKVRAPAVRPKYETAVYSPLRFPSHQASLRHARRWCGFPAGQ
ncbi:MAG TPA: hypothetical protein VHB79_17025 [Polyangiaceae bacterium]|nr:hypothetical protein [Polyangiaceae bacterium]